MRNERSTTGAFVIVFGNRFHHAVETVEMVAVRFYNRGFRARLHANGAIRFLWVF